MKSSDKVYALQILTVIHILEQPKVINFSGCKNRFTPTLDKEPKRTHESTISLHKEIVTSWALFL